MYIPFTIHLPSLITNLPRKKLKGSQLQRLRIVLWKGNPKMKMFSRENLKLEEEAKVLLVRVIPLLKQQSQMKPPPPPPPSLRLPLTRLIKINYYWNNNKS